MYARHASSQIYYCSDIILHLCVCVLGGILGPYPQWRESRKVLNHSQVKQHHSTLIFYLCHGHSHSSLATIELIHLIDKNVIKELHPRGRGALLPLRPVQSSNVRWPFFSPRFSKPWKPGLVNMGRVCNTIAPPLPLPRNHSTALAILAKDEQTNKQTGPRVSFRCCGNLQKSITSPREFLAFLYPNLHIGTSKSHTVIAIKYLPHQWISLLASKSLTTSVPQCY